MADLNPSPTTSPAIPEQLRRQIAEADSIREQMAQGGDAPPPDPNAPPQQDPPPPQQQQPPLQQDPPPPQQDDEDTWEQRYRSLAGRTESLVQTNKRLGERLNQLDNLVSTLQATGAQPPSSDPPPAPVYEKATKPEDVADYGEDLLNVIGRRSRDEYAPEFDKLSKRIQQLEGRVEGVGKVIVRDQTTNVYSGLDQHVEGWRDINVHPVFKTWLQDIDPFSGRKRQDMLTEAFSRHETGRVVAFFKGFLAEAAGNPPNDASPGPAAPPLPNGNGSEQRPSLEDFAAPGRARSAPPSLPADKPVYTSAQIAKFYADKRVGLWRGREAEAETIERDIFQAQHEGRIQ